MDPAVPSDDDPNAGLDFDIGVALHEWETRWAEIEEARQDDEGEAIHAALDLLEEMYRELHVPTGGVDDAPTEDLHGRLKEIREVDARVQSGEDVTAEELDDAYASARDAVLFLVGGSDSGV